MMRPRQRVVVDGGARLFTSIPVILETFTFLDRNAARDVASTWKSRLEELPALEFLPCTLDDLSGSWETFSRSNQRRKKPPRPGTPRPRFARVEKAIRGAADGLLKTSGEINKALEGPRTDHEIERLRAVQHECGRLHEETLRLLAILHGL